ncbi:hypothetical protein D3C71_1554620 [compost metagenome]
MRASWLARETRSFSSVDSGTAFSSVRMGKGFICAGSGRGEGTATTSMGLGNSGSTSAATGSSRVMDGGGIPCVAQPARAASRDANTEMRKDGFMTWLLRKNPVRGSTTGH